MKKVFAALMASAVTVAAVAIGIAPTPSESVNWTSIGPRPQASVNWTGSEQSVNWTSLAPSPQASVNWTAPDGVNSVNWI